MVESHLAPHLGGYPLRQLGPAQLNTLYAQLSEDRGRAGKGSRRPPCARARHAHKALRDAVRWGSSPATPPTWPTRPRAPARDARVERRAGARVSSPREGRPPLSALSARAHHRHATRRARRPRWEDVDLDGPGFDSPDHRRGGVRGAVLHPEDIEGRLRRRCSIRATVVALRAHAWPSSRSGWRGVRHTSTRALVFTREDGRLIHPQALVCRLRAPRPRLGPTKLSFHGLRHTYATLLSAAASTPDRGRSPGPRADRDYVGPVPARAPGNDDRAARKVAGLILGS